LRCIKGKPGTIHPADLSTGIAKTGSNNVELIYVQTHQQFVAAIYVVERKTITSFIEEMKRAGRLTKDKVLEKCKYINNIYKKVYVFIYIYIYYGH
jgi:hypothetical protein